jgi:predicted small lipoprotein YifL
MRIRAIGWLILAVLLAALLAACGSGAPASLREVAPLDASRATFLYFFTDP